VNPILTRSEITDAVYIVTKYKILEDGLVRTIEKYDVTDQFDAMTEPLRAENAKLRKLADAVKEFIEDIHCEDCPCRRDCDDNNRIFCINDFSYHAFAAMRKLEIEMD
jgi:hypothetical protein